MASFKFILNFKFCLLFLGYTFAIPTPLEGVYKQTMQHSLSPTSLSPKSLACLKGENVLVSKNTMIPTCIAIDIMLDPKPNELK